MKAKLLTPADVDLFGDLRAELVDLERALAEKRGLILGSGQKEYDGTRYRVTVVKKTVERLDAAKLRSFILSSSLTKFLFGRWLKSEQQTEVRTNKIK